MNMKIVYVISKEILTNKECFGVCETCIRFSVCVICPDGYFIDQNDIC